LVLLRPSGVVAQAEVHVEVDGNKPLTDVELLLLEIEMEIRFKVPSIERASIIPHSFSLSRPETRRSRRGGRVLRG
jgi:divalent metal cation (Fe/Co/Zn/Cd) transporter